LDVIVLIRSGFYHQNITPSKILFKWVNKKPLFKLDDLSLACDKTNFVCMLPFDKTWSHPNATATLNAPSSSKNPYEQFFFLRQNSLFSISKIFAALLIFTFTDKSFSDSTSYSSDPNMNSSFIDTLNLTFAQKQTLHNLLNVWLKSMSCDPSEANDLFLQNLDLLNTLYITKNLLR
jgi:hypothetical protein